MHRRGRQLRRRRRASSRPQACAQAGSAGEKTRSSATARCQRRRPGPAIPGARSAGSELANLRKAAALSSLTRQNMPVQSLAAGAAAASARASPTSDAGDLHGILAVATAVAAQIDDDHWRGAQRRPAGSGPARPPWRPRCRDLPSAIQWPPAKVATPMPGLPRPIAACRDAASQVLAVRTSAPLQLVIDECARRRAGTGTWRPAVTKGFSSSSSKDAGVLAMSASMSGWAQEGAGPVAREAVGLDAVAGQAAARLRGRARLAPYPARRRPMAAAAGHDDARPAAPAGRQQGIGLMMWPSRNSLARPLSSAAWPPIVLDQRQSPGGIGARRCQRFWNAVSPSSGAAPGWLSLISSSAASTSARASAFQACSVGLTGWRQRRRGEHRTAGAQQLSSYPSARSFGGASLSTAPKSKRPGGFPPGLAVSPKPMPSGGRP